MLYTALLTNTFNYHLVTAESRIITKTINCWQHIVPKNCAASYHLLPTC